MAKTIIIDPGHGGTDPGANGFGVREKDWNLRISLYQYERLKELGAKVSITRTNDKSLSSTARTNIIRSKYDYCISNHWNAFNGKARGIETIHSVYGGKELATNIANALVRASGLPLRRVFSRKNSSGGDYYFMHRLTGNTRTVIIEYGFIDNADDHNWYKNEANFYKAAEAVIKVLCKELGIAYKAKGNVSKPKPVTPASKPAAKPKPQTTNKLAVDGYWGPATTRALQRHYGTTVDGKITGQPNNASVRSIPSATTSSTGSLLVRAMQRDAGTIVDGKISAPSLMIRALQKRLGTPVDGIVSKPSLMVKEMQRRLNNGTF